MREGGRDYDQSVVMMNFTARPEQQWKFILAAVNHANSDDELGHLAAGPIEHLLGWHGEKFIVTTTGLKPSPSGETFRTFVYRWKRRQGKLLHETTAVQVFHQIGMESGDGKQCFQIPRRERRTSVCSSRNPRTYRLPAGSSSVPALKAKPLLIESLLTLLPEFGNT